jgi:hypothetical protein
MKTTRDLMVPICLALASHTRHVQELKCISPGIASDRITKHNIKIISVKQRPTQKVRQPTTTHHDLLVHSCDDGITSSGDAKCISCQTKRSREREAQTDDRKEKSMEKQQQDIGMAQTFFDCILF